MCRLVNLSTWAVGSRAQGQLGYLRPWLDMYTVLYLQAYTCIHKANEMIQCTELPAAQWSELNLQNLHSGMRTLLSYDDVLETCRFRENRRTYSVSLNKFLYWTCATLRSRISSDLTRTHALSGHWLSALTLACLPSHTVHKWKPAVCVSFCEHRGLPCCL